MESPDPIVNRAAGGLPRKLFGLLLAAFHVPLIGALAVLVRTGLTDFRSACQVLSLTPDFLGGLYARRLWYRAMLPKCGPHLVVGWLAAIEHPAAEVGSRVYIGPRTSVGLATIGDDVLISSSVTIVSGLRQHALERGEFGGAKQRVHVGNDTWIGAGAIIGADVSDGCIVGAGSVLVKATDRRDGIYVGNPARRTRERPTAGRGDAGEAEATPLEPFPPEGQP